MNENKHMSNPSDVEETVEVSELKIITFTLAGKEYGIDIMQVKEISRMMEFTYIPNAPFYVRGVYNLRGEIISVIDLRLLFHLPLPENDLAESEEDVENLIVLQFGDYYLGVVVDKVDKVCSVRYADVQSAHPLFSDISIKYINGLVHHDNRLYILLNVNLLADGESAGGFGSEAVSISLEQMTPAADKIQKTFVKRIDEEPPVKEEHEGDLHEDSPSSVAAESVKTEDDQALFEQFTAGLESICGFYVNEWSYRAVYDAFSDYLKKNGSAPNFHTLSEYAQLLPFLTKEEEEDIWSNEYFDAIKSLSFDTSDKNFNVWVSWCGYGHSAYSLAAALLSKKSDLPLRVWATDDDLLKISMGPNLMIQNIDPSSPLIDYAEETKNGFKFKKNLAEKLLFEYHSVENGNQFPKMKFIVAKGRTSYYNKETAGKVIFELCSKLDNGGYIMVADYESLPESDFRLIYSGSMRIFRRI